MNKLLISIIILSKTLTFELAVSKDERRVGMMFRKEWGDINGMIFVNEEPRQVAYWMKNTYLDMTMMFLDKNFEILEIVQPVPMSTNIILSRNYNVMYVLEIKKIDTEFFLMNYNIVKPQLLKKLTNLPATVEN